MNTYKARLLITGATGFIGQALIKYLIAQNFEPIAAVRKASTSLPSNIQQMIVGDLLPDSDWEKALSGIDVVIHLAARAHILNDTSIDPLTDFRKTNTFSTLNLAKQAAEAGVRRFIFISSIGVNGNHTLTSPFTVEDTPDPIEPYAISKHEAEIGLQKIAVETNMEIVIIRPPLVYGPNAPGNFASLIKIISRGLLPLPLGAIHNKRSFVSIDNLLSLITTCVTSPNATNQTFLVSDDEDLSTTDLLKRLAQALDKPIRLIPIPVIILTRCAKIAGKQALSRRLCSSLHIDINHTKTTLNWKPPITVDKALKATAVAYLAQSKKDK